VTGIERPSLESSSDILTGRTHNLSNLAEEEPSTKIMEDKEPKPSDPSLSDAPLDRYTEDGVSTALAVCDSSD
jgi:hypothetical protein